MKELTKAEQQIMEYLWQIGEGFVNDILAQFPEPKPAYNTVSTIVRILEKKKVVGHKTLGKSHQYYPLVTPEEYRKLRLRDVLSKHFNNSYKRFVSFFAKEEDLSVTELEEIQRIIEEEIHQRKKL